MRFSILFLLLLAFNVIVVSAQTITSFFPTSATTGTHVIITGTGFTGNSNDYEVNFNGVAASSFTILNSTTIIAVVGAGASGNVQVVVKGAPVSRSGFTYYPPTPTASWPFSFLLKPTCNTPTLMPGVSCTKWPEKDGSWSDASIWNNKTVPRNMDIVCIPAGRTVYVSGKPYPIIGVQSSTVCPVSENTMPRLFIFICGTLDFDQDAPGKLELGCQSAIQVWDGGFINSRGGNAELIQIGSKVVWRDNNKDVPGPYYFSDGCGSNPLGCQGEGTLPVILKYFQGKLTEFNRIDLTWATTHEYNSSVFDIERSEDGSNWVRIGSVKSIGGDRIVTNYSFTDRQPLFGKNIYRLKQIDLSGEFSFSDVVSVELSGQSFSSYNVYPNPAKDKISIYAKDGFSHGAKVQFYQKNGTLIQTKMIQSSNAQTMDISDLSNGVYYMRIVDAKGTSVYTQSVIKN